jgi:hypothetical protein
MVLERVDIKAAQVLAVCCYWFSDEPISFLLFEVLNSIFRNQCNPLKARFPFGEKDGLAIQWIQRIKDGLI